MTVTERHMKAGQFTLDLTDEIPYATFSAIQEFDHIVITPTRLANPLALTDSGLLGSALYTGVILGRQTNRRISGQGLAYWLGTDDGRGDLLDTAVTLSAANLGTALTALVPSSLTYSGFAISPPAGTVTATYQWITRREAIDSVCRALGAEWRITPNGRFVADSAQYIAEFDESGLNPGFTFLTRRRSGAYEYNRRTVQAQDLARATDVAGYTTKVIVVGKKGDGALIATGSATGANVYKDFNNNNVVLERFANAPQVPSASLNSYATAVLGLYSSTRRSITLSSDTHVLTTSGFPSAVRAGGVVYVYDVEAGLTDPLNYFAHRGEILKPVKLRVRSLTWPVREGMGVYVRRSGATPTYTDVTDYVKWENSPTQWEVGASMFDLDQDPQQVGGAFLGVNPEIVNRLATAPGWVDFSSSITTTGFAAGSVVNSALYRRWDDSLDLSVQINGNRTAGAGVITVALPLSLTCRAFTVVPCLTANGGLTDNVSTARISSGGTVVTIYADATGANFAGGADATFGISVSGIPVT